jgi:hypothetical protein
MDMLGIDFVGPITPACSQTGARYVLIAIDYFSRFTWAYPYRVCTMAEVAHLLINHITPVFGWPKAIYSDNGSHFTGAEINRILESHGVEHYTAPVTHPSSVGLVERNVQLTISELRKRSVDSGLESPPWGTWVPEATVSINTRLLRIHGYSPSQLLFGFTPKLMHLNTRLPTKPPMEDEIEQLPAHQYHLGDALRSERRELAMWALVTHQVTTEERQRSARYQPVQGDLVIVRDKTVDNQRGRKLEPKWKGPRLVVRVSRHGLSAEVREIYGDGASKRYHVDDMKQYYSRGTTIAGGEDRRGRCDPSPSVITARTGMEEAVLVGQKAVMMTDSARAAISERSRQ